MGKVYCFNCKYFYQDDYAHNHCLSPTNIKLESKWYSLIKVELTLPEILNGTNTCSRYKRLWYKFWLKKRG